jgi:hypothetical protein
VLEKDGVKFVADKEFSFLVEGFDIIKAGNGFGVDTKSEGCH